MVVVCVFKGCYLMCVCVVMCWCCVVCEGKGKREK